MTSRESLVRSVKTARSSLARAVNAVILEEQVGVIPPITEMLSGLCFAARVSLFLSGFAYFHRPPLRAAYNAAYCGSFLVCLLICALSALWGTPPLYSWGNQLNTLLFHVLGLHTWLFWRRFSLDPRIRALVHSLVLSWPGVPARAAARRRIRGLVLGVSHALLAAQLGAVLLAFAAFSQPAYEHWATARDAGYAERAFSLVHALLMWAVIPLVIPTLLASLSLFFFVMICHCRDITEVVASVRNRELELVERESKTLGSWSPPIDEHAVLHSPCDLCGEQDAQVASVQRGIVNAACTLADNAQRRLDYSCSRLALLSLHQVGFGLLQVIVLITHWNSRWAGDVQMDRAAVFHALMDAFHGSFALVIMLSGVLTPAMTTHVYIKAPRMIISAMCNRGVTCCQAAPAVPFLYSKIVGFTTVGYAQITGPVATKVIAAASCGSALYASTLSYYYASSG